LMLAFGARKLVTPSLVVQTVQTSVISAEVMVSFRSIFGSTEFTVLVLAVDVSGLLE